MYHISVYGIYGFRNIELCHGYGIFKQHIFSFLSLYFYCIVCILEYFSNYTR